LNPKKSRKVPFQIAKNLFVVDDEKLKEAKPNVSKEMLKLSPSQISKSPKKRLNK